uniref:MyoD family inhibitor domain containing 2 n=1 Tax=Mastacembelus armatus TaxID=205130 RepID=A0A7N8X3E9_9TELE
MTAPSKPPVDHQDCIELEKLGDHVSDGSTFFSCSTLTMLPDDCAALLLACLHCRFHELMVLLPDTCERAVSRCFPSYRYITASSESEQQGKDCCTYTLELDCNFCSSCHDAGELIELAMEISEICYR